MNDKRITYPDAYLEPTSDGQWKLTPSKGPVSYHDTHADAYDALKEIRESPQDGQGNCGGDEGCLMCSG